MSRASRHHPAALLAAVLAALPLAACGSDSDPNGPAAGRAIETSTDARAAFAVVRDAAVAVYGRVPVGFSGPMTVTGQRGSATVSGTKTESRTSSSSSSLTQRSATLAVSFSDFETGASGRSVDGAIQFGEYYSYRMACSSYCASNIDQSFSLDASSVAVRWEQDGETYSDVLSIDASRPRDTTRWEVRLTTRAGQSYSFSLY